MCSPIYCPPTQIFEQRLTPVTRNKIRFMPLSFSVTRCSLQTTQVSLQLRAICQHRVFDGVEAALPAIQFEALRFG